MIGDNIKATLFLFPLSMLKSSIIDFEISSEDLIKNMKGEQGIRLKDRFVEEVVVFMGKMG